MCPTCHTDEPDRVTECNVCERPLCANCRLDSILFGTVCLGACQGGQVKAIRAAREKEMAS